LELLDLGVFCKNAQAHKYSPFSFLFVSSGLPRDCTLGFLMVWVNQGPVLAMASCRWVIGWEGPRRCPPPADSELPVNRVQIPPFLSGSGQVEGRLVVSSVLSVTHSHLCCFVFCAKDGT
jgi:hypothetical protein